MPGFFVLWAGTSSYRNGVEKRIRLQGHAQGTTYHITYYAADTIVTISEIDSILGAIDLSLSLYKPESLVNLFNKADKEITPDRHLYTVTRRALTVYHDTKGLFDITIFPLTDIWGFGPQKRRVMPDSTEVKNLLSCVGSEKISLSRKSLRKSKSCVKLDPNGIAQGYSVDIISEYLEKKGISRYLVELGGEIRVKGRKPDGQKMSVGIEAPAEDMFSPVIQQTVYLEKGAITTSGNYRNFYESNGRSITHIIDPATGYPQQRSIISATVVAKDAITADAYDNVFMLMSVEEGLKFANARKDIGIYLIYKKENGEIGDTMNHRFRFLLQP